MADVGNPVSTKLNQLSLHYQPHIELATGKLYGVEALARWTHPQLGSIPPTRFIPLAEDCGLIADLEVDEAARALSSAILGIGSSLSLTVVAEGIETPAQNRFLREQGYPVAQGYLFAKPMAPEQMGCWLTERKQCGVDGSVSIEDTQHH